MLVVDSDADVASVLRGSILLVWRYPAETFVTGLAAAVALVVGMVFQEYGLYPNMDVFHNVAYGLEARGIPKAEVRERVTQAAVLGLSTTLGQSVVDLSGGEQQRVALARALAMADRIGVMAKGRLQQVGTPEQLLDDPRNMFVARFIGSPPMNLISGDGASAIRAIVADVEPLIGETSVVFRLTGGDSLVGMFAEDMEALSPGLPVQIAVQSDGIELFDPETELSLRAA